MKLAGTQTVRIRNTAEDVALCTHASSMRVRMYVRSETVCSEVIRKGDDEKKRLNVRLRVECRRCRLAQRYVLRAE